MSQYPGGPPPPPQDPWHGQPPADPYAAPPQYPGDPYFGGPPPDPYAPPQDPYYGGPPPDPAAWQQPYYGQPPVPPPPVRAATTGRSRGGSGAAVIGLLLVLIGVWILFGDQVDLDLDLGEVWPVGAVMLGALMVVASVIPRGGDREGQGR